MTTLYANVIVDSGPLVAILDQSDQYHTLCVKALRTIQPPMWTTWPVLTEVAWLIRDQSAALKRLYSSVETGLFRIAELPDTCLTEMTKYRDRFPTLRLQLADATLFMVSERDNRTTIFTLDRRDFSVISKKSRVKLRLLPESLS